MCYIVFVEHQFQTAQLPIILQSTNIYRKIEIFNSLYCCICMVSFIHWGRRQISNVYNNLSIIELNFLDHSLFLFQLFFFHDFEICLLKLKVNQCIGKLNKSREKLKQKTNSAKVKYLP